jgi:hypothetical protein
MIRFRATACRDGVRDQIPSVLDIRRTFVSERPMHLLLLRIDLADWQEVSSIAEIK